MDLNNLKRKIQKYKFLDNKQLRKVKVEVLSPFKVCTEIVASIIVGLIIGSGLDSLLGTNFTFKVICLIFGCIASFKTIYKMSSNNK